MHYRLKKMAHMASGEVLDIGYAFHPNPFLQGEVVGLDLQEAPKPENYARTIVMDAERLLDLNEKFDTVIAGEVIEHLFNPYQFLSGIYTVLNEGGKVILSTPNPYNPPSALVEMLLIRRFFYAEGHVNIFLPRFLVRAMERAGFHDVKVLSGGWEVPFLKFDIPFPRAWCTALIYVGTK